ncbi:MAG TPA: F0F1 ATP synthase subunit epsilon [Alphaproteobacteria bacterium]
MAETTNFELVSPERLLLSQPVEMVVIPGSEGDIGVLPRHAPLITTLRPGTIAIYENNRVIRRIFVAGGFAEVTPERCTVLADETVALEGADRAAAEARLRAAREALAGADTDEQRAAYTKAVNIAEELIAAMDRGEPALH